MHYQEALKGVLDAYFYTCTAFGGDEPFPDIIHMPAQEAFLALAKRAKVMKDIFPEIGIAEWNRFSQEFDVVRLLTLIAYLGTVTDDVPIASSDISAVENAVYSMIAAGWREDRQTIDVAEQLIAEAMKSRELPGDVTLLITAG